MWADWGQWLNPTSGECILCIMIDYQRGCTYYYEMNLLALNLVVMSHCFRSFVQFSASQAWVTRACVKNLAVKALLWNTHACFIWGSIHKGAPVVIKQP